MPRPWAGEGDRACDRGDAGEAGADGPDPPSADDAADAEGPDEAEDAPFPTLDLPWPDDDVGDRWWIDEDGDDDEYGDEDRGADEQEHAGSEGPAPLADPGPPWPEPTPCRVPRRQVRPVHRRRSRHAFEPEDLSDTDLDRLLRGSSPGGRPAGGLLATGARSWPAWVKLALAASVLLIVVGVVGVITAAGDTPDTITTRDQRREPLTARPPTTAVRSAPAELPEPSPPPSSAPPTTAALPPPRPSPSSSSSPPPWATEPVESLPPARSSAAALPPSAADRAAAAAACHPSYDPCVPVADDVDCAGGQGNGPAYLDHTVHVTGPDVYALDADHDNRACERPAGS